MPDRQKIEYNGFIPPCGIFCGGCPNFTRDKNICKGFEAGCKTRKCKGIYVCCIENKGLEFCHQCQKYPCSRFKKFANTWQKYGQDLMRNQELIKALGKDEFIKRMNKNAW